MCVLFVTFVKGETKRFEGESIIRALGALLAQHRERDIKCIEVSFNGHPDDIVTEMELRDRRRK